MNRPLRCETPFAPCGDQPRAIEQLVQRLNDGLVHSVLLGVTGSGKTFTMAKVIERLNRPALILAPNKTLAAQLFQEFKAFFPDNAVEYFVSYYDYYQPEAYVPSSDTFIEKDASINKEIEKYRLSATRSLLERRDVIIVASVSCIYGLGSPEFFGDLRLTVEVGRQTDRQNFLRDLVHIQYVRNSSAFYPGTFRVQGDTIDVYPLYDDHPIRIEWFDDEVERIARFDGLTGKTLETLETLSIFPSTHFVTPQDQLKRAAQTISEELDARVRQLHEENRLVEAQRLSQRTQFDLEMMMETGYCSGIENYSRHLDGRPEGTPPSTLLDYFPDDFLLFIDESHVGVSQVGGMYHGDRNRKTTLVEYGFRLPSARDNRPLTLEEFWQRTNQVVFVSATPGDFEVSLVDGEVVEQIIRPTGLMDPLVDVRPPRGQIEDLLTEIRLRAAVEERALVTTLTKKMAEDLAGFFEEHGVKVAYLHSDIDAIERIEILQALRKGVYDVVVGVNLLREGLDLPEVSLVAILDADKEGFLRSRRSLIQTIGRAARNTNGMVIMYADKITDAMRFAIEETARRRNLQHEYNQRHGITPQTVKKDLRTAFEEGHGVEWIAEVAESDYFLPEEAERTWSPKELKEKMAQLEQEMRQHAAQLAFEEAARCRDELSTLKLEWMKLQ